jgi:sugar (pentulose or hexulose) kinase
LEIVSQPSLAAAVGAGLTAWAGLGQHESVARAAELVAVERRVEPDLAAVEVYTRARQAYGQIYPAASRFYRALAGLSRT